MSSDGSNDGRTVYIETHGQGMYHDDPDCEFLFSATDAPLSWVLKRGFPACSCVQEND